jgi:ubiquitin carboxyl-terminal hydrolase 2/21
MDFEKYKGNGLSGLANLGNTCFINSCMQVLSHTYELNQFLDQQTYKKHLKHLPDSTLFVEWDNLRQLLWSKSCIISPNKFIKTIHNVARAKNMELFTGFTQNDLPEFFLFIIDCFHTSLSREIKMTISGNIENDTDKTAVVCYEMIKKMYSNEYSEIWNMFYAIHVSEIISLETGKQLNMTAEPFLILDLPIPSNNKSPSLLDCLDLYVEGEVLEGENAWFNEKTQKKENVRKKISFWSFPNILVIDLKRFNYRGQKNQIQIDFPLENLNLSKYVVGYKKNSFVYDLYGVCNHSGSSMGGHYTAFVKNADNNWYLFNDTTVGEVKQAETIVSPKAYCLFYRKRNK